MNENKNVEIFDNPDELDRMHLQLKALSKGNKFAYMALMLVAFLFSGIKYIVTYLVDGVKEIAKNLGV